MTLVQLPVKILHHHGRVGVIAKHPSSGHWIAYAETKLGEGYDGEGWIAVGSPQEFLRAHGGVTFGAEEINWLGFPEKKFYGMDYAHYADDLHPSELKDVEEDLIALIESVIAYEKIHPQVVIMRAALVRKHELSKSRLQRLFRKEWRDLNG